MKKTYLIILIVFYSCVEDNRTSIDYYNKNYQVDNINSFSKKIDLKVDTVNVDLNGLETSYNGNFIIYQNKFLFNDLFFGYIFQFDEDLKLNLKKFGLGNGHDELKGIDYVTYSPFNNKFYVLSSKTGIISVINEEFKKEKEFKINFNIKRSKDEVISNPLPHLMDSYELDYGYEGIFKVYDENHLAIAVTSSHPKFNGYYDSMFYYRNARILALINIEDEYVDRLIGRRPIYFLENQLPNFDHFNFEIYNKILFYNFYPEHQIYKTNTNEDTLISVFGNEGIEMKKDYVQTKSYNDAFKRENEDYTVFNFYNSLFVDDNFVFRGYTTNNKYDGLQIYQKDKLLDDLNFPKGYKIIGKIGSNYYASKILIKKSEDMHVLKIKISGL